jgi:hypothetical protein
MRSRTRFPVLGLVGVLLLGLVGCGKQVEYNNQVEGIVTLNGKPLANVHVEFVPDPPEGARAESSRALTDENGRYALERADGEPGAMIGNHFVVILRGRGMDQNIDELPDEEAAPARDRRLVPARYAMASTTPLRIEVLPAEHTYNLELRSNP